jgi:CubicO group peptidase (beta-lactamase class C family)
VRHLLQHTSGIPGTNSTGSGDDVVAVLPSFLEGGPKAPPGTRFEYWNQGYALASEVIARAAGKSYTESCKAELFGPAKLNRCAASCPTCAAIPKLRRASSC